MEFGPDVRARREELGIDQQDLSAEMSVSQSLLSQYETERQEMPTARYFEAHAAIERIIERRKREADKARDRAVSTAQGRTRNAR